MSRSRSSPRKFSEKIALLNKKEAEHNAEFEKIIKEVELTTRAQSSFPVRTASFSNCYSNSYFTNGDGQPIDSHHLSSNYNYTPANHNQQLHYSSQNQLYPAPRINENCNIHHNPSPQFLQQQNQLLPEDRHQQHNQSQQQQTTTTIESYQIQQQPQQQPQKTLNATDIYIQSNSNSPGVPNIRISPTDDGFASNQQVNYVMGLGNNCSTTSTMANQMSTISSARSLPDIANLRVSTNSPIVGPPIMHQSYSDERLNNNLSPEYYSTGTNIIPESVTQTDLFPSNEMSGGQQQPLSTSFSSQDINFQNPIQDQFQNIHITDNSYQGSPTWQNGYYTSD